MNASISTWARCMTAGGLSQNTVDSRVELIQRLARATDGDPSRITRDHILALIGRRSLSQWSRCTYYQNVQAWAAWCDRPDLLDGVTRPRSPRRLPDPLPERELVQLLAEVADPRMRAWILLGAYAGLRSGEVSHLHGHQIHPDELRIVGKGDRVDVLPLAPVLAEGLAPWDGRGRLWDVDGETIARLVKAAAKRAGVDMRFHQLRHRFGTAVYRATRDLLLTQRLMRHSSPETTAGYARLVDDAAEAAVMLLPGATPGPTERTS